MVLGRNRISFTLSIRPIIWAIEQWGIVGVKYICTQFGVLKCILSRLTTFSCSRVRGYSGSFTCLISSNTYNQSQASSTESSYSSLDLSCFSAAERVNCQYSFGDGFYKLVGICSIGIIRFLSPIFRNQHDKYLQSLPMNQSLPYSMHASPPYCTFCRQSRDQGILRLIMLRICCVSYQCVCNVCALANPEFNPGFICHKCGLKVGKDYLMIQKAANKRMNVYIKQVEKQLTAWKRISLYDGSTTELPKQKQIEKQSITTRNFAVKKVRRVTGGKQLEETEKERSSSSSNTSPMFGFNSFGNKSNVGNNEFEQIAPVSQKSMITRSCSERALMK